MENTHRAQDINALTVLRRTTLYAGFRTTVEGLAILGYLALGFYAGAVLVFQEFAFGIMAVLTCLASAATLHVGAQLILILVDIADAQMAGLEESNR